MRVWWEARTPRERLMLGAMLILAVPILVWLLVVRPIEQWEESAREDYLLALDRNARVRAVTRGGIEAAPASIEGGISALVGESAAQRGFELTSNTEDGEGRVRLAIGRANGEAALGWLRDLEGRGVRIETLQMTPNAEGGIALTATLSGAGR